jgi:hypothetical protein
MKNQLNFFLSIFNPTYHSLPFCLDFLPVRTDYVGKSSGGKLGWSDLSISCRKLHVRYYKTCCACKQRSKNHKKNHSDIMTSTRSFDYEAIGEEEEDNDSTPVAFDVDDGDAGKVEVNSECKGNGNSNGPVDNNNNNDYDVKDDNNDNNDDNGGGRTELQMWDDCGGVGRDGGRGGEGGGG